MRNKSNDATAHFTTIIWEHYRRHHRNDLPWRKTMNPYRVVVSEIMLQQTQVSRVVPKYRAFIKRFSSFKKLAGAPIWEVLLAWQGLGYNRRAILLKRLAEQVVSECHGTLPDKYEELLKLPSIGPATAAAVLAFAFNKPSIYIDTNVRRVYLHFFFPKRSNVHDKEIVEIVKQTMDYENPREWNWALLDYGSMLGTQPENANTRSAHYAKQPKFEGSLRQLRGRVIRLLLKNKTQSRSQIIQSIGEDDRLDLVLEQLEREQFFTRRGERYTI